MEIKPTTTAATAPTLNIAHVSRVKLQPVEIEIGPVGCLACTSGDSPIWDFEQNVLFGF